jgi:outer membrane protein assembly factor BamB
MFGLSIRGENEVVWSLSETDGRTLWVTPVGRAVSQQHPQGKEGPGCTPTVDGDRIYLVTMAGMLICLQTADGRIVWQRDLVRDFRARVLVWSFRESPLIDGEKLICTPGGEDATIVALDKLTGRTIWTTQLQNKPRAAFASPIAIESAGQRQYVHFISKALVGIAATDGKLLWTYSRSANPGGVNISTPIYHNEHVFASAAYGAGAGLVKLSRDASGEVSADEVWLTKKFQSHHGGVVLFDGCLFGANGGSEGGALACVDFATGTILWDERDREMRRAPKGSVALVDGRLYYRTESGPMLLVEPNRLQYVEHGRFEQPDRTDRPAWAHPVVANGKLYLRDHDRLFCYDVKDKTR